MDETIFRVAFKRRETKLYYWMALLFLDLGLHVIS